MATATTISYSNCSQLQYRYFPFIGSNCPINRRFSRPDTTSVESRIRSSRHRKNKIMKKSRSLSPNFLKKRLPPKSNSLDSTSKVGQKPGRRRAKRAFTTGSFPDPPRGILKSSEKINSKSSSKSVSFHRIEIREQSMILDKSRTDVPLMSSIGYARLLLLLLSTSLNLSEHVTVEVPRCLIQSSEQTY